MTIGISKERLIELLEDWREAYKEDNANIPFINGVVYALDLLVNECAELNPMSAFFYPTGEVNNNISILRRTLNWYAQSSDYIGQPTHWQELPEDPK